MKAAIFLTLLATSLSAHAATYTENWPDETPVEITTSVEWKDSFVTTASDGVTDVVLPSKEPDIGCKYLNVKHKRVIVKPGQNATFICDCHFTEDAAYESLCPLWQVSDGVLHSRSEEKFFRGDHLICRSTISIPDVRVSFSQKLSCRDISVAWSISRPAFLEVISSGYGEVCKEDLDCLGELTCMNKTCECPDHKPVFVSGSRKTCYPVSRLFRPCTFNSQCRAWDNNTFCDQPQKLNESMCLCSPGYEQCGNNCVKKVRYFYYLTPQRYQTVWLGVIGLIPILIILMMIKLFLSRRAELKRMDQLSRSTSASSLEHIVDSEKPKNKF